MLALSADGAFHEQKSKREKQKNLLYQEKQKNMYIQFTN